MGLGWGSVPSPGAAGQAALPGSTDRSSPGFSQLQEQCGVGFPTPQLGGSEDHFPNNLRTSWLRPQLGLPFPRVQTNSQLFLTAQTLNFLVVAFDPHCRFDVLVHPAWPQRL